MKLIELTLIDGDKINFVIGCGPFSYNENVNGKEHSRVNDGTHNNGGYKIKETVDEITKKIINAKEI